MQRAMTEYPITTRALCAVKVSTEAAFLSGPGGLSLAKTKESPPELFKIDKMKQTGSANRVRV